MFQCWPTWSLSLLAGIMGAILGSFANVCIVRMPRDESVIWPPSHCPICQRRLKFWENVPIVSFIALRGRCSGCRERISWTYPLVEAICVMLSLLTWWYFQDPMRYLIFFVLLIVPLVIITFIDLRHMIIPDIISIPGIFVGIAAHTILKSQGSYLNSAMDSVVGAVVGGGLLFLVAYVYEKLKKQEGLGGGDVKLIAMLGAFLGWKAVLIILLASSILGSLLGLTLIIVLRKDAKYPIPYGPFLALAGVLYLFVGDRVVYWYLSLFI